MYKRQQLLNLAGQVQILSVVGLLVDGIFKTHINQLVFLDFQRVNISFGLDVYKRQARLQYPRCR